MTHGRDGIDDPLHPHGSIFPVVNRRVSEAGISVFDATTRVKNERRAW
jgi:hypothetical protein